jgi:hypothetical protein
MDDGGVSPATTAVIAAAAGIAGVLLAGWMARSRDRWVWRADNRRDAYLELLRALENVRVTFEGVVVTVQDVDYQREVAEDPDDPGFDEQLQEAARRAEAAAIDLDHARARGRLLGSRKMRKFLETSQLRDFTIDARLEDAPSIVRAWNSSYVVEGERPSSDQTAYHPEYTEQALEWIDEVEELAVTELRPDRLRALLERIWRPFRAWRFRRSSARKRAWPRSPSARKAGRTPPRACGSGGTPRTAERPRPEALGRVDRGDWRSASASSRSSGAVRTTYVLAVVGTLGSGRYV